MSNQNISSENPFASQAGFDPTAAPQQQQQGQSQQQDPWSQAQPQQNQSQQSGGQDPWSQAQQGQDQQAQPQQDPSQQPDNQAPQFQAPQSQQEQQNGQGGFQGQQPDNQAPQFQAPQDQGQGGFQNQQNGFQNQGGFQGQQNQGGFQNQQNGFQNQGGFQGQQNGFQNQGGFQGQQNGFQNQPQQRAGETVTASGPAVVDLNNPDQYMYRANQDRGDIRKEGDAILLMVPTKIEYDVPSKYGNGNDTYNRCVLDFLVVTGPNQGTVYRDSMNFNSYIIYSMQDALKRNMPIVGMVKKKETKKAPNGAWMIETVEDENIWYQAAQMGVQAGLLRSA